MTANCTACGRSVRFNEDGSWALVCPACGALTLRSGEPIVPEPRAIPLLPDLSPMRVGTAGRYGQQEFRITGRIRVEAANGYRNFWSLKSAELPYRWLMHAYGNYALLRELPSAPGTAVFRSAAVGRELSVDDREGFIVEYLDKDFRFSWEGELMGSLLMSYSVEVEAGRAPNDKLIAHVAGQGVAQILLGVMVDFPELGFENAPELARWI